MSQVSVGLHTRTSALNLIIFSGNPGSHLGPDWTVSPVVLSSTPTNVKKRQSSPLCRLSEITPMDSIYLDFNATTPIDLEVAQSMFESYQAGYVNPASIHHRGQEARRVLETDRREILQYLGGVTTGMKQDRLVFTSGGTESNNLALFGLLNPAKPVHRVLVSAVEHPSVSMAAERLKTLGAIIEWIPVDQFGKVDLGQLQQMLLEPADLVSVMMANNETGTIQPISKIAQLCLENGVLFHVDAVQAVGKLPVHFRDLQIDALSFTAHKLYGPRGIGGLILKHGLVPIPQIFGGFQQMGIRPGTEDVGLVRGMSRAIELAIENLDSNSQWLRKRRDQLQDLLLSEVPDLVVNGLDNDSPEDSRTPQTLNISVPGINRQEFLMAADLQKLAISTGSACASGSSEPSPVLQAMGLSEAIVEGSIRISLGVSTSEAEVAEAAHRILLIIKDLRQRN